MKIDRIEFHVFGYPIRDVAADPRSFLPIYTPGATHEQVSYAVVVQTDGGVCGEFVPTSSSPQLVLAQCVAMARLMVGVDLADREWLWDTINSRYARLDRIGYGPLEVALFDAVGKSLGVSVSNILGCYRRRLPTYASTMIGDREPDGLSTPRAYAEFAAQCLAAGATAFKVHAPSGAGVDTEIEILQAIRTEVGAGMTLMTNPAPALSSYADALRLGLACDELNVAWLQQPMRGNSIAGYARLRRAIRTPILLTEHVRGLESKADVLIGGGTDFLRADPEIDMGFTGTLKAAHIAEGLGADIEIHAAGPSQRHCVAAIRNTSYYELGLLHPRLGTPLTPPVYADGYTDELSALDADGCVSLPDGPGLGVTYNWDFIAHHRRDHQVVASSDS